MYGFVKEKSENTHISSCEVLEIENKYNINFPTMLKEYYLQHNGMVIRLDYVFLQLMKKNLG